MENIMEIIDELNNWLIKHLEPICEADPIVLSKYVIALIQKSPGPGEAKEKSLRQKCLKQLEIFLGNETTSFVDTLFDVIKNRSFQDNGKSGSSKKKAPAAAKATTKGPPSEAATKSRRIVKAISAPQHQVKVEGPTESIQQLASSTAGSSSALPSSVVTPASRDIDMRIIEASHSVVDSSNGLNHLEASEPYLPSSVQSSTLMSLQTADNTVTESMPQTAAAQVVSSSSLPSSIGSSSGFVGPHYPVTTSSINSSSSSPMASSIHPIKISLNVPSTALSVPDHHFMPSAMSPQPSGSTVNASGTAPTSYDRYQAGSRSQAQPGLSSSHSRASAVRGTTRYVQHSAGAYYQHGRPSRSRSRSKSRSSYYSSDSRSGSDGERSRSNSRSGSSASNSPVREVTSNRRSRDRGSHRSGGGGHRSSRIDSPISGSHRGNRHGSSNVASSTSSRGYSKSSHRGIDSNYRSSRSSGGGGSNSYHREHSPSSSRHHSHRSGRGSNEAQLPSRYQNRDNTSSHHRDQSRENNQNHSRRSNQQSQRPVSRSHQPSSSSRGRNDGQQRFNISKQQFSSLPVPSGASSSTLIDYQALAAQYAMTLAANTPAGADTTNLTLGLKKGSSLETEETAAASSSDRWNSQQSNQPSSSADEKSSTVKVDATTSSSSAQSGDHSCPDTKEKGYCDKGLYCVYNSTPVAVSAKSSGSSATATSSGGPPSAPPPYYDEPYNPEAATIDPSMLIHMLPGFMQLNPLAGQMPPMANRFLGPANGNHNNNNSGPHQDLNMASASDEQQQQQQLHSSLGGSFEQSLKMLQSMSQGGPLGMLAGGSGGRPRELVGVSLSGGEPYVPKSLRPASGEQKGSKGRGGSNYGNNSGYGHFRGGNVQNKQRPNVIDIMDRVNPNNAYENGPNSRFSHTKIASEIYVPGGADLSNEMSTGGGGQEEVTQSQFQQAKVDTPMANDKTWLLIRKIPPKLNNIGSINKHFGKYGTVVNIQVCYENCPESALVQFSNSFEATAAIRSTEAVFNNRFIKVYWAYQNNQNSQHNNNNNNKNHGKGGGQNGPGGFKKQPWQNKHQGNQFQQQLQILSAQKDLRNELTSANDDEQRLETQEKPNVARLYQRKVLPGFNLPPGLRSQDIDLEALPSGPSIKIISPAERAARLKELTEKSKSLQEAMQNQKHLMGKLEQAKTPKEKTAILKLLQLTMKNIKTMQEAVEKIQNDIKPTLRTTKINNKSAPVAAVVAKADEAAATSTAADSSKDDSVKQQNSPQGTPEEASTLAAIIEEDAFLAAKRARLTPMDSTDSVESSTTTTTATTPNLIALSASYLDAGEPTTTTTTTTTTIEKPTTAVTSMEQDDEETDEE